MVEGSMSRNKKWRYMHVLHFFHEFVKQFVAWTDYIREKQLTWRRETLTPDANKRLCEAEIGALRREARQTTNSKIFGVKATDGQLLCEVDNIIFDFLL